MLSIPIIGPSIQEALEQLAQLVNMIDNGTITGRIAKNVADDMLANPNKECRVIVEENPDYRPMTDREEVERMIDQVLAENQQSIQDFRSGRDKAFAFLVGQVMKLSRGKASPKFVNEQLLKKLNP